MSELWEIESDADLERALARIEEIFFAEEGTPEDKELEDLVGRVRAYETARFPREMPDPIEAIKFTLELGAYLPDDLASSAVSYSEVFEVLSGTRPLSYEIANALSDNLGIPMEVLWPHSMHSAELANETNLPAVGTTPD